MKAHDAANGSRRRFLQAVGAPVYGMAPTATGLRRGLGLGS
jgi:hypothetical protein